MLDPFILNTISLPTPPATPVAVQEEVLKSSGAARAERIAENLLRSYETAIAEWKARSWELRQAWLSQPVVMLTSTERTRIEQTIGDFEEVAEIRARAAQRAYKRLQREVKNLAQFDPSLGAVTRSFNEKCHALDREVVDIVLEYVLFLRAMRAERIPEARGGPVFDDPDELLAYLRQAVA